MRTRYITISIFCLVIGLSACSKGGGSGTPAPPEAQTTLNGMVSKGPIKSATVKLFDISFGAVDTSSPLGQGQTDDQGNFSVDIASHQGPAVVEVTGGSFTDEVSGASVALNVPLHTIVPDVPTGSITTVATTPLTELAFRKAKGAGDLTPESMKNANASIASTFGLDDIVTTVPAPAGSDRQKKYAAACGAFSQLMNDNRKLGESFEDALARLMTKMGDEEEHTGKLSTDSTVMINRAILNFSNNNAGGAILSTLPTPTRGLVRFATSGAPSIILGIDVTIALPADVVVDADPLTGETAAGVVTISGLAAIGSNTLSVAKFTPAAIGAPAQLHIALLNSTGFGLGEFVTVQFNVVQGGSFPLTNSFVPVNMTAKGITGASLAGVSAVPMSVEGI